MVGVVALMRRTVIDWMGNVGVGDVEKRIRKMIPPKFGTLTTRKILVLFTIK